MSWFNLSCARKAGFGLVALLMTTGCGFHPLYGTPGVDSHGYEMERKLAAIEILPIANRVGQQVHNYLLNNLNPGGPPQNPVYFLNVDIDQSAPGGLSRSDLDASRTNVQLTGYYTLSDQAGTILLSDSARAITGFDVFRDPLNDISAKEDARARSAELLARQIANRLAAYFSAVEIAPPPTSETSQSVTPQSVTPSP